MWDHNKKFNIHVTGFPGEEKKDRAEKLLKIVSKKLPNFTKDINVQIQAAEQTPNRINPKKSTPRHILLKTSEN